jgi:cytoskeletal protein CcmA (bactofilin family)
MSENSVLSQTVLEEGTEIDGSIRSKCPITVSGKLKGDICAPSLTITQSGSVSGQVKVSEFKSEGDIAGEIDAESVELSGHVSDHTIIRASSLQVKLAQNGNNSKFHVTFGNCDLKVGEPVVKALVKPVRHASPEPGKKEQFKSEATVPALEVNAEPQLKL